MSPRTCLNADLQERLIRDGFVYQTEQDALDCPFHSQHFKAVAVPSYGQFNSHSCRVVYLPFIFCLIIACLCHVILVQLQLPYAIILLKSYI